ncbi:hypothetical protein P2318_13820 [Myxococcaceae bacterium GXIMD 01537]
MAEPAISITPERAEAPGTPPVPEAPPRAGSRQTRGALLALGVLVLGVVGAEAVFRGSPLARALAAENLYIRKARTFSASEGADIAMTGDSRILHGFASSVVADVLEEAQGERPRVYNAGLSGAPPMAQLAWVRRFVSHERRPRLVLMGISPYMFSSRIAYNPSRESLTTVWRLSDLPTAVRAGAGLEELSTIAVSGLFESVRLRPRLIEVLLKRGRPGGPADVGQDGYLWMGGVPPSIQESRARGRGRAYRTELWKPEAHFGNEQMGYFIEALRLLRAEGIPVLVVSTPSASQLDEEAYGPQSLYDEHIAWVKARAAEYGATFVDMQRPPGVPDSAFADGDHLSGPGAARFTETLAREHILPALGGPRPELSACRPLFTFDEDPAQGWTLEGEMAEAMRSQGPAPGQQPLHGFQGRGLFNSFTRLGDEAMGQAQSPPFALEGSRLRLRVGGGAREGLDVALLVEGREVASARGRDSEVLSLVTWDVSAVRGKTAVLRIRDLARGGWGHLLVDDVRLCP